VGLAREVLSGSQRSIGANDGLILLQVGLVGEKRGGIVMLAKCAEGWERRLDHGDVVGAEDKVEDLKDIGRRERDVLGRLLDKRGEDAEGDLDIADDGKYNC
jgi:hypothetical protein